MNKLVKQEYLCLRHHRAIGVGAAHGVAPPEDHDGGGAAHPRQAGRVGVLLPGARSLGIPRRNPDPEGLIMNTTTKA